MTLGELATALMIMQQFISYRLSIDSAMQSQTGVIAKASI
jgi:hypothetical protein